MYVNPFLNRFVYADMSLQDAWLADQADEAAWDGYCEGRGTFHETERPRSKCSTSCAEEQAQDDDPFVRRSSRARNSRKVQIDHPLTKND